MIAKASTNLIKVICEVATGKRKKLIINGNNFNTKDGTTIRDFIHVSDLAQIHNLSAKYLIKDKKSQIFNCGYGNGFSIMDVIKNMNFILKKRLPFIVGKPRKKDIYFSVANTKKFNISFKWKPKYNSLNYILTTALNWEKKQKC
jgi:UDP-glucose 4-epimerase